MSPSAASDTDEAAQQLLFVLAENAPQNSKCEKPHHATHKRIQSDLDTDRQQKPPKPYKIETNNCSTMDGIQSMLFLPWISKMCGKSK